MNLSLPLLSNFLLAITLAKTEDKETPLMEFIQVSFLVPRAGQRRMKKGLEEQLEGIQAITELLLYAGYLMCMLSLELVLLWG